LTRDVGEVLVRHLGLFGSLSDGDKDALMSVKGEVRDLEAGEDVLTDGERRDLLRRRHRGLLERYTLAPDRKRQIHSFTSRPTRPRWKRSTSASWTTILGRSRRAGSASCPSRSCTDHGSAAERLGLIWRETLVQAAILRAWLMRNSRLSGRKDAHLFCEIMTRAKAAGLAPDDTCDLPVTHEDIGDALGWQSVHVNRTLTMLRDAGLADLHAGRLIVLDWLGSRSSMRAICTSSDR
jgi:CRP-like cAMP-binding protein